MKLDDVSHIGISTGAYGHLSLAAALDRVGEEAGFAEVCSWGHHMLTEPSNLHAVASAGVPITVHGPFAHHGEVHRLWNRHRAVNEMHRRHMSAAAEAGALLYVVHPDPHMRLRPGNPAAAAVFDHTLEELRGLQAETGVSVAVENLPFSWLSRYTTPWDLDLDGLGFVLDVGHAAIEGTFDHWLKVRPEALRHVHLHDNLGLRQHDSHMALGSGVVDAEKPLALARAAGATVVLEHIREEDVASSLRHLRERGLLGARDGARSEDPAPAGSVAGGEGRA